mgnify:CR=1 FL=1
MNIFELDENPLVCASMHCDKHVVKMPIEYAQLLSTAHRVLRSFGCFAGCVGGRDQESVSKES